MPFHPDPDLRQAFNGYQGQHPLASRLIFLGKDANFPGWGENPLPEQNTTQRNRVLAFLGGQVWTENCDFRESAQYLSRNLYPDRAHHPLLLSCFQGNDPGAKYHRTMACLIDRVIDRLQASRRYDLANSLITQHSTFVELVRIPTPDNNGNHLNTLFEGDVPNDWPNEPDFRQAQEHHRTQNLPEWLLNSQRSKAGHGDCIVVLPMSTFRVLCHNEWQGLNMELLNHRMLQFQNGIVRIDAEYQNGPPLPEAFEQCRWFATERFPYFRGNGVNDAVVGATLTGLGQDLADELNAVLGAPL
jgi:hypothetical protein